MFRVFLTIMSNRIFFPDVYVSASCIFYIAEFQLH